jgi:hypothetical protein
MVLQEEDDQQPIVGKGTSNRLNNVLNELNSINEKASKIRKERKALEIKVIAALKNANRESIRLGSRIFDLQGEKKDPTLTLEFLNCCLLDFFRQEMNIKEGEVDLESEERTRRILDHVQIYKKKSTTIKEKLQERKSSEGGGRKKRKLTSLLLEEEQDGAGVNLNTDNNDNKNDTLPLTEENILKIHSLSRASSPLPPPEQNGDFIFNDDHDKEFDEEEED